MKIHLPATTSASDTPVSNLRIRATTLGHPLDGDDAAISKGHDLPISEIDHTAVVESVGDQDSPEDLTRVKDHAHMLVADGIRFGDAFSVGPYRDPWNEDTDIVDSFAAEQAANLSEVVGRQLDEPRILVESGLHEDPGHGSGGGVGHWWLLPRSLSGLVPRLTPHTLPYSMR